MQHSCKLAAVLTAVLTTAGLAWAQDPAAMKKEHEAMSAEHVKILALVAQIDSLVTPVAR